MKNSILRNAPPSVILMSFWFAPGAYLSFLIISTGLPSELINISRFVLVLGVMVVTFFTRKLFGPVELRSKVGIPILIYLFVSTVSTILWYQQGLDKLFGLTLAFLLLTFHVRRMNAQRIAALYQNSAIIGFIVMTVFVIVFLRGHLIFEGATYSQKGYIGEINSNAVSQGCLGIILLGLAISNKWMKFIIVFAGIIYLLSTWSRTAFTTLVFGVIVYLSLLRPYGKKASSLWTYQIVGLCMILFVSLLWGQSILDFFKQYYFHISKIEKIETTTSDKFLAQRPEAWDAVIQVWQQHPLIGNGISSHVYHIKRLTGILGTHNGYFAILIESGIIGLCVILYLVLHSLARLIKKWKVAREQKSPDTNILALMIAIQLSMLVYAFAEEKFLAPSNLLGLSFLLQIFWAESRPIRKKNKSTDIVRSMNTDLMRPGYAGRELAGNPQHHSTC